MGALTEEVGWIVIDVAELAATEGLGITIVAGEAGAGQLITWAHTVDLPDPWNWVSAGDLVMTTSAGMPTVPQEQVDWVRRLADTHVSALLVAAPGTSRPISPEMAAEADRRRLPVLAADFELEFARVSRVVIGSALESQKDRLAAGERLFSTYASVLRAGGSMATRLAEFARRCGWQVAIEDQPTGQVIAASNDRSVTDIEAVAVTIPGRTTAVLRVRPAHERAAVSPPLVHYLAGLIGIELEIRAIERDSLRVEGETLLQEIIDGTIDLAAAHATLVRRGLGGELVIAALAPSGPAQRPWTEVHHSPAFETGGPLLLEHGGALLALIPHREKLLHALADALGTETAAGISEPLTPANGAAEAVRQARVALVQAQESGDRFAVAGSDRLARAFAARSVAEARALVERYLGPLIEYDHDKGTELIATLTTFLGNDGALASTASDLLIHRQTLVYRLRTIERVTGLKPSSTRGTATFWLALQAGQAAGLLASPFRLGR